MRNTGLKYLLIVSFLSLLHISVIPSHTTENNWFNYGVLIFEASIFSAIFLYVITKFSTQYIRIASAVLFAHVLAVFIFKYEYIDKLLLPTFLLSAFVLLFITMFAPMFLIIKIGDKVGKDKIKKIEDFLTSAGKLFLFLIFTTLVLGGVIGLLIIGWERVLLFF
jgi:hypothetical protein